MDAHKLANELVKLKKDCTSKRIINQAIHMLRRQANRIAKLEMTSNTGDIERNRSEN